MEQQKKIAAYLKVMTVIMMAAAVVVLTALTITALAIESVSEDKLWQFIFFTYMYFACSMAVLVIFYKVCTKIGDGKSFSEENALYFRYMERAAFVAAAAALARIIWCMTAGPAALVPGVFSITVMSPMLKMLILTIGEMGGFVIFGVMCRALSALIDNAAKMQQENELTI